MVDALAFWNCVWYRPYAQVRRLLTQLADLTSGCFDTHRIKDVIGSRKVFFVDLSTF